MNTEHNPPLWQSKHDKNIKKQTQLCNPTGILDNCKLNCAKVQRSQSQLCNPTGILDNCKLNCAKVQRSQSQLCNPTGILDNCKLNCAKVQRSQSQLCNPTGILDNCKLNCAKVQRSQSQLCNPTGILDNCKLNCAKVQRFWMLQSQLCKIANAAISTGMDMDAVRWIARRLNILHFHLCTLDYSVHACRIQYMAEFTVVPSMLVLLHS